MATVPVTEHPDLSLVLGALDDERRERVYELLDGAHARLDAVHRGLMEPEGASWTTDGVVLETALSGQTSIDVRIEEAAGKITFEAQLRPRNYFPTEAAMWQPGRAPLVMATDGWDVDGGVSVRFKTRVGGRPYTIQQQVSELEERRYDDALAAVEAFAAACEELAVLATSREATVEAWKPPEPEA